MEFFAFSPFNFYPKLPLLNRLVFNLYPKKGQYRTENLLESKHQLWKGYLHSLFWRFYWPLVVDLWLRKMLRTAILKSVIASGKFPYSIKCFYPWMLKTTAVFHHSLYKPRWYHIFTDTIFYFITAKDSLINPLQIRWTKELKKCLDNGTI
jgi:hypothetical protein